MTSTTSDNKFSVLKAAWVIAFVTILSKLAGFVRDMVLANYYGATLVSDAYFYACQIPSLAIIILGGIGGPFHSSVVAVFSKLIPNVKEKPSEVANRLYNTFLTVSFIFFFVLAILCFIFADKIIGAIISGGSQELISLATLHFKIMIPILVIGGIIGIYYGLLICYNEFSIPSLSPMILSLVVILMVVGVHNDKTGVVLATATTVGALCQLLIQLPKIIKFGFKLRPNLDVVNNPHFKSICELLFPAILSSTIGQVHIYIDMFFASSLREGAWTSVVFANRIFQFPVGILVTAFLVPLFPIFSRMVEEKNFDGIRTYFNKGVGVLFFGSIPIIIGILLLGQDGIRLVFERGAFNSDAVFMVTLALWFLSFSILPYVFRDSITRVYYSFNDSATPFIIAACSILLKVGANILLVDKLNLGIAGITASTSLVTLFNAVMLGVLISRKLKMDYKVLFKNFAKMVLAGVITYFVCFEVANFYNTAVILPKYVFEGVKIGLVGTLCLVLYIGLNYLFKMDYTTELFKRFRGKKTNL